MYTHSVKEGSLNNIRLIGFLENQEMCYDFHREVLDVGKVVIEYNIGKYLQREI